jgi:hypothetical protein
MRFFPGIMQLKVGLRLASKLAVLAIAGALLPGCSRQKSSEANAQATKANNANTAPVMAHTPQLPDCPSGKQQSSPPPAAENHHKVVLSWNASTSAGRSGNPVGYCLYRSNQQIFAKELKDCKDCELVTPKPIVGTGCVDPVVQDGKTYYYVAITRIGQDSSKFSSQTIAVIPPDPKPLGGPSSYPLCRQPVPAKP